MSARPLAIIAATLAAALLFGCNGGGDDGGPGTPTATAKACDAQIASLTIANAKIVKVQAVAAGPLTPQFSTQSLTVPALCQVIGYAAPTSDSQINFELWIPP